MGEQTICRHCWAVRSLQVLPVFAKADGTSLADALTDAGHVA